MSAGARSEPEAGGRPAALRRARAGAAGLASGMLAGFASVTLHGLDWGLALATLACTAALLLAPAGAVRGAAAAGWVLAALLAARGGPGGDVIVAADAHAAFLALDGLIFSVVAAATWPRNRGSARLSSSS